MIKKIVDYLGYIDFTIWVVKLFTGEDYSNDGITKVFILFIIASFEKLNKKKPSE